MPPAPRNIRTAVTLTTAAALTIASIAAMAMLESSEERSHSAQTIIADVQTDLSVLQMLPFRISPASGGSPQTALASMTRLERRVERSFAQLTHRDVPPAHRAALRAQFRGNAAELHRALDLFARQDFSPAAMAQLERVVSASDRHRLALERLLRSERSDASLRADRAQRHAALGSAFALVILLLAFAFFYRRSGKAHAHAVAAKAEADRANHAKSEFLSRMSHELRTPLNAILGFGQLLAVSRLDDRQRGHVDHVARAGGHLLDLINEVLDISRIESGDLRLSLEPVRLRPVLDDAVDLIRPLAATRGIDVDVDDRDGGTVVLADVQRVKQVLLNLLSNAVKYNVEGGRVDVVVTQVAADRVEIAVADTGPGIDAELIDRLFNPFERLGAEASAVEGTGLGLALSRGFVEAMGGRLEVESTPGQGTTFTVTLSATEPVEIAAPAAPERRLVEAGHTVVCIEDNPSNIELIEQVFTARPELRLLTAVQGTLGLALVREHRPDLVLLDLHLPDIPGQEVLARLQADPELCEIPVVVVSADATEGQLKRMVDAGAHAYLTKPINIAELLRVVDDAVLVPVG